MADLEVAPEVSLRMAINSAGVAARFQKRALFVNLLGIGNCIMSTPAIAALHELGYCIDVIVCRKRGSDVAFRGWGKIERIFYDRTHATTGGGHEVAFWAHPVPAGNFHPACRIECVNPHADDKKPYYLRFPRHEVIENLELARRFGYTGPIPSLRPPYSRGSPVLPSRAVAIGIGYLKTGRWDQKHWGNAAFAALCRGLLEDGFTPMLLGDRHDQERDGVVIQRESGAASLCGKLPLPEVLAALRRCVGFVGNDTGLMHAAAAYGLPTLGIFRFTSPVKNSPWGRRCGHIDANAGPLAVRQRFRELCDG